MDKNLETFKKEMKDNLEKFDLQKDKIAPELIVNGIDKADVVEDFLTYSAARAAIDPSLDSLRKIKDREFTTNWSTHDLYNKQRSDEETHQIQNLLHQNRGEKIRTFEEHKLAFQGKDEFFNKLLTIRNRKRKNDEN